MENRLGERPTESFSSSVDDIAYEEDLLIVDRDNLRKLSLLFGYDDTLNYTLPKTVQEVADFIQTYRVKIALDNPKQKLGDEDMKTLELAEKIKKENEEKLGNMNEKKIAFILRKALEEIRKEIEETNEEQVMVANLGKFNIRMVEKEVEGEQKSIKRIIFHSGKKKIVSL